MTDLTPEQQALLGRYHSIRTAWESGGWITGELATAYAAATDACIAAGFDPFITSYRNDS